MLLMMAGIGTSTPCRVVTRRGALMMARGDIAPSTPRMTLGPFRMAHISLYLTAGVRALVFITAKSLFANWYLIHAFASYRQSNF